ncbi:MULTISPECIES: nuclear transport factor 2 family protein [Ramlibacter]|uniref:Nuclear transport factor 2 family protein n=1 Tax=Ramlibacter aquaticus TaxID=2780094 RepID=A0ABR9SIN1_9BURK|nr:MULTISPECIES: nuclear transport factor 2 family protein [Ramlibacter]MBE7942205.1 nuclear transport factor 2 family protein [Ramlibacter aquaticus]
MSEGTQAALARIVAMFETLAPADVARLGEYYCEDAFFKDPFNEVRGLPAVQRIFGHMFETLDGPHFVVTERMAEGDACWLAWEFRFRFRKGDAQGQVVRGATHLRLAPDGRIRWHRDYWDAAEELYEKIPLLGALMRWLKRRIAAA